VGTLYTPALEDLLGPARKQGEPLVQKHKDLARSAQALYEEAFFALLNALYKKYQCPNLALSGGCAMNSVANGKVYLNSPFKKMYLPAAAGDAGGAIGAAFVVWNQLNAETPKSRNTETPSGSVTQLSTLPNSTPRSTLHASRCPTPTPALGTMTPR
jgi:carbamoyltransferase